jgi:predicted DNA-binding protein
METKNKRATVYLDPELHRALKIKSARIERTMSELINDAIHLSLAEDYEDLQAIEERQNEPNVDFKDILKDLKDSGKL